MGTKNLARLYAGVCKADKIGRNGGQPSTCCLCTLQFPYIIPGLVPTGFTNLRISFDILLESPFTGPVILKSNAPFVSCITRINGELIEDADDLDIVMSMYNLLEYSKNYRKTIRSLYNYYRDELTNDNNDNFANRNVVNSEAFKYKNKITGNTYNVDAGADGYDVNKNDT